MESYSGIIENMIFTSYKQKAWLAVVAFLLCLHSSGQKLVESRQTSYYTYIFRITERGAREICT